MSNLQVPETRDICSGLENGPPHMQNSCSGHKTGPSQTRNRRSACEEYPLVTESTTLPHHPTPERGRLDAPDDASTSERKVSRRNGVYKMAEYLQNGEVREDFIQKHDSFVELDHGKDDNYGYSMETSDVNHWSPDRQRQRSAASTDVLVTLNDRLREREADSDSEAEPHGCVAEVSRTVVPSTGNVGSGTSVPHGHGSKFNRQAVYEKKIVTGCSRGGRKLSHDSQLQVSRRASGGAIRRLSAYQRKISSGSDVNQTGGSNISISNTAPGISLKRSRRISAINIDLIPQLIQESLQTYLGLSSKNSSVLEEKDSDWQPVETRSQRSSVFSTYSLSSGRSDVTFYDPQETLPHVGHYDQGHSASDLDNFKARPTLYELRQELDQPVRSTRDTANDPESAEATEDKGEDRRKKEAEATKLGWIQGVLIRCLVNIFGVMLFLRMTWMTGQAGIGLSSVIILISALVTTLTAMSMSAIGTNGDVGGGGAYYVTSRNLGPEFGGALAVVFSLANAVAVSMHVVGFAETFRDILNEKGVIITGDAIHDVRLIGCVTIGLLLCVVMVGLDFATKAQIVLLTILSVALGNYFVGTFIPPSEEKRRLGFVGYQGPVFLTNFPPDFRKSGETDYDFFKVFAIFFPSATGVLAGANISGDLKNPASAISRGTFLAILITTIVYLAIVWTSGSCMLRDAVGISVGIESNMTLTMEEIQACGNATCNYGLNNSHMIMGVASAFQPLIYAGIFAATLSSALDSLVSAPKVLQALAKDKLFPFIGLFAKGYGRGDDPRPGHILTVFIAVGVTCIGSLDIIAPIISNFFLISFLLINYSCFDAAFANTPGFRPSFRFFSKWLSLFGALLCLVIMFLLKWWAALATVIVVAFLYVYIKHSKPDVNWGTSCQARAYSNALKTTLKLVNVSEHVKNFRPQILAMTGHPSHRPALVDFAYSITKRQSLLICAHITDGDDGSPLSHLQSDDAYRWLRERDVRAFYTSLTAPTLRHGARSLLQCQGLGRLRPNTLLLGFKADWQTAEPRDILGYVGIIHDAFDLNFCVGVLRFPSCPDQHKVNDDILTTLDDIVEDRQGKHATNTDETEFPDNDGTHKKNRLCEMLLRRKSTATRVTSSEESLSGNTVMLKSFKTINLRGNINSAFSESEKTDSKGSVNRFDGPDGDNDVLHCTEWRGLDSRHEAVLGEINKERKDGDEKRSRPSPSDDSYPGASSSLSKPQSDAVWRENMFQAEQSGTIDVWWLFEDGGLGLLVPYILTTRRRWHSCKLRVFCAGTKKSNLEKDFNNMTALLRKFRIDYSDVTVLPDLGRKPLLSSYKEFQGLVNSWRIQKGEVQSECPWKVSDTDLKSHKEKTYMQLKIREKLLEHSKTASLIVVTLPVPRKSCPAGLYMAWLDSLSRDLPPTLLLRGNQQSTGDSEVCTSVKLDVPRSIPTYHIGINNAPIVSSSL